MPRTSLARQLLADRTLHIVALAVAGLLAAPLGACVSAGGDVNGAGGGGAGGNGVGVGLGSVGVGGAGGGGAGGAQPCDTTSEYASVSVTSYIGDANFCNSPFSTTLAGVVRVAGSTIIVDSCHPNDNCAPMESVITLLGTDFSVSIPVDTFVEVHLHSKVVPLFGCLSHVTVRNLPTWGGTPNPTSDGAFLWLAYHDALDDDYSLPDDPYQTEREFVCENEQYKFHVYAFRFSFPDAPGAEVVAPQGQTVTWTVPEGEHAGEYRVRNVKALFWNHYKYNYWIARK